MRLEIIKSNIFSLAGRMSYYLFLLVFLMIDFFSIFNIELNSHYFTWLFLLLTLSWFTCGFLLKKYQQVGTIILSKDKISIIENGFKKDYIISEIDQIDFYYGGYDGEQYGWNIFLSGYWFSNGTNNYLAINMHNLEIYNIYIKNRQDSEYIKSLINQLHSLGKNTNLIKRYSYCSIVKLRK